MKPYGRHPQNALTARAIKSFSEPKRYADGRGLYLVVDGSGNKRWLLRLVVQGKRRDIGLGGWPDITLAHARDEATKIRQLAKTGGDPIAERRKAKNPVPTFGEAAHQVHKEHALGWSNPKHAAQWIKTLETYAFPYFGKYSVDQVDTAAVMSALSPIWLAKPETARRVRQRVGAVLDWAKAKGYRNTENPVSGLSRALPKQQDKAKHHASLPYSVLPSFLDGLRSSAASDTAKLAFEFLILTATRTSEVLKAEWSEIDLEGKRWVIPAERMKAKREFMVPLAPRTLAILEQARSIDSTGKYLFEGRNKGKPLSQMTFSMLLRRMDQKVTAHGFRSTFRDWAAERTNMPREICEAALAHVVKNKTEAAYLRTNQFEKRRTLMAAWAKFATQERAEVVPIKEHA